MKQRCVPRVGVEVVAPRPRRSSNAGRTRVPRSRRVVLPNRRETTTETTTRQIETRETRETHDRTRVRSSSPLDDSRPRPRHSRSRGAQGARGGVERGGGAAAAVLRPSRPLPGTRRSLLGNEPAHARVSGASGSPSIHAAARARRRHRNAVRATLSARSADPSLSFCVRIAVLASLATYSNTSVAPLRRARIRAPDA